MKCRRVLDSVRNILERLKPVLKNFIEGFVIVIVGSVAVALIICVMVLPGALVAMNGGGLLASIAAIIFTIGVMGGILNLHDFYKKSKDKAKSEDKE